MVLCFDIGNTDIDVGVFEKDIQTAGFSIPYTKALSCWDYIPVIRDGFAKNNIRPEDVKGCAQHNPGSFHGFARYTGL